MNLALNPFGNDVAQHAGAAGAWDRLRYRIDDVDVLAQDISTELHEGVVGVAHGSGHRLGSIAGAIGGARVLAVVFGRIEAQSAVGAHVQLGSPWARDFFRPFRDCGFTYSKFAADCGLRAEELDYVTLEHGAPKYRIGNRAVNDGKRRSTGQFVPMDERNETMGERIRRLREAKNLTQPALARLLISMGAPPTLTKAAIHKWESGDTKNMQNATFILLCQALGTDPPYLLWGPDRVPREHPAPSVRVLKRKS